MPACETFADNLGRQTEIRTALRTVQATGVAGEELGGRRDDWCLHGGKDLKFPF